MSDDTPARLHAAATPDDAVNVLQQAFPHAQIWHGDFTKHYHAYADGHRLEVPTALGLYHQLRERRAT
jgi:hypothetical protein